MHSTCSDGLKTPQQLVKPAIKARLTHIALCDHDTVSGVAELADALRDTGIALIPGVEISSGEGGRTHILAYGETVLEPEMQAFLAAQAQERKGRAKRILALLRGMGIAIGDEEEAQLLSHHRVGRAHIARLLVQLGVVPSVNQAFGRYLERGRPAYVPRNVLSAADTVRTVRQMGAVPVLAHPLRLGLPEPALAAFVTALMEEGLMGIEVWHTSATSASARLLDAFARMRGLLVTGGSDYHAEPSSTIHLGRLPSGWQRCAADIAALLDTLSSAKGAFRHV